MNKICIDCKVTKDILQFCKHNKCKDGYTSLCKECKHTRDLLRYGINKDIILAKNSQYRSLHKNEIKSNLAKYYLEHKSIIKENVKNYKLLNKDKIRSKQYHKKYIKKNYDKFRKYQNNYRHNKKLTDPIFKIRCNLANRIRDALKNNRKCSKTMELLGCSKEYFKSYLESKFLPGMSWDNYNHKGWHVDHIKPCAKFDLTKETEQRSCFHYTNLQPLWSEHNYSKGSK